MFNLSYHHPYLGLLQTEGLAYPFHKAQHKRPKLEEMRGLKLGASLCWGGEPRSHGRAVGWHTKGYRLT